MQEKTLCSALPTSSSGHIAAIFDKLVPLLIRSAVFGALAAGFCLERFVCLARSSALVGTHPQRCAWHGRVEVRLSWLWQLCRLDVAMRACRSSPWSTRLDRVDQSILWGLIVLDKKRSSHVTALSRLSSSGTSYPRDPGNRSRSPPGTGLAPSRRPAGAHHISSQEWRAPVKPRLGMAPKVKLCSWLR